MYAHPPPLRQPQRRRRTALRRQGTRLRRRRCALWRLGALLPPSGRRATRQPPAAEARTLPQATRSLRAPARRQVRLGRSPNASLASVFARPKQRLAGAMAARFGLEGRLLLPLESLLTHPSARFAKARRFVRARCVCSVFQLPRLQARLLGDRRPEGEVRRRHALGTPL